MFGHPTRESAFKSIIPVFQKRYDSYLFFESVFTLVRKQCQKGQNC